MLGEVPAGNRKGVGGRRSLTHRPAHNLQTMIVADTGVFTDTDGRAPCAADLPSN